MRTIVKVIIKIFTLMFFISALNTLLGYIASILNNYYLDQLSQIGMERGVVVLYYIAGILVLIAIAALFLYFGWRRTDSIVKLMLGDIDENQLVIYSSNADLHKVLINFLGIFLIISSLPAVVALIPGVIIGLRITEQNDILSFFGNQGIANFIAQIITFFIGVWLVFGGKAIARGLVRLKNIGLEPPEREEDSTENKPGE